MGAKAPTMLKITETIAIPLNEIALSAIRSQGAGGQNVNKVASAIHLRFDIHASSLPDYCKRRLLRCKDRRITREGVIVIKAQQHRTQEQNRSDALERLKHLIRSATLVRRSRRPTRPTRSSQMKRLDQKTRRGRIKALRARKPRQEDG
jgi:ribosome-associated protein